MKVLNDRRYKELLKKEFAYNNFQRISYWFSEYKFLKPVFNFMLDPQDLDKIVEIRAAFKDDLNKDLIFRIQKRIDSCS